jgi:phosphoglycerate dehydrogenase-like enzyme
VNQYIPIPRVDPSRAERPWTLLALSPLPDPLLRRLTEPLGSAVVLVRPEQRTRAAMLAALPVADLVLSDWSGALMLDQEAVAAAGRLSFVQQPVVGVDGHDLAALAAAGIPLANAAGTNDRAVAEWCLAAALALLRDLVRTDERVRAGEWPELALRHGELAGLRVGLVGFGAVGRRCASLFSALGSKVAYWSRRRDPESEAGDAVYLPFDRLLARSELLIIGVALTPETTGLIDAAALAALPAGSLLVNAARGPVVDRAALLAALESGHLAGAALDVFDPEPPEPGDPLLARRDVLLSPHIAGATRATWERVVGLVTGNLAAAVSGTPVRNVVNGVPALVRRRDP